MVKQSNSMHKPLRQIVMCGTIIVLQQTMLPLPLGTDQVVVDLLGLGKGEACVNGQSLGRYWPTTFEANEDGCNDYCDYRGNYSPGTIFPALFSKPIIIM